MFYKYSPSLLFTLILIAMKKLTFLPLFLIVFNSIFSQVYELPIDGISLYYMLDEHLLLELDTLNKFYIKSDHSTRRIIIDKGKYESYFVNDIVFYSTLNRDRMTLDVGTYYLKNKILYLTEKDMKKNRNGIVPVSKEDLKVPYKFNTLFAFSSFKRISIKKEELQILSQCSDEFRSKFLSLLQKNIPNYYEVIANNYIGPLQVNHFLNDKQVKWNRNTSDSAVMYLFGIIGHESIHKFNNKVTNKILITPGEYIEVKRTETLPTIDMIPFFEQTCNVDNIYRFNAYCNSSGSTSSVYGVYGMLDEFSAYYHETNITYIMYNQYKNKLDLEDVIKGDFLSSVFAYYEFNLFIGGYLSYLKNNNTKNYNEIINNKNFCLAYSKINELFGSLTEKLEKEFVNDNLLKEINELHLNSTKQDLQQFLPELEVLKNKMIVNK